jgi:RNA polymerase sigma-70 factor (ECF subfamily)
MEYAKDEAQLDYLEFARKLDEVIDLLPPRRKEIFVLHCKQELKNTEIAAKLGLSEQFIKNQLSVARKFVIAKMKDDRPGNLLLIHVFFCGD